MLTAAGNILHSIAQLLWPQTCACCGTNSPTPAGLCDHCAAATLALAALEYCPRCGGTLGPGLRADEAGCWACPATMFRFRQLVRVGPYAGPLRRGVHRLKYGRRPGAARRLGELLAQAAAAHLADADCDVVVPVPMYWLRRLGRGWNHSTVLAEAVARGLDLPLGAELVRIRNTPPQVNLPASRRIENVRGAFKAPHRADLAGANVLLVDDVVTTGATANEAARTLLDAGAQRVFVAVVARAEAPTAYAARSAGSA